MTSCLKAFLFTLLAVSVIALPNYKRVKRGENTSEVPNSPDTPSGAAPPESPLEAALPKPLKNLIPSEIPSETDSTKSKPSKSSENDEGKTSKPSILDNASPLSALYDPNIIPLSHNSHPHHGFRKFLDKLEDTVERLVETLGEVADTITDGSEYSVPDESIAEKAMHTVKEVSEELAHSIHDVFEIIYD